MSRRWIACMLVVAALGSTAATGRAKEKGKKKCKQDCSITLRSCKQDCQMERASGRQQESYRYRLCDQSCHDAYAGCTSQCESR
jgi:hypothetical protein